MGTGYRNKNGRTSGRTSRGPGGGAAGVAVHGCLCPRAERRDHRRRHGILRAACRRGIIAVRHAAGGWPRAPVHDGGAPHPGHRHRDEPGVGQRDRVHDEERRADMPAGRVDLCRVQRRLEQRHVQLHAAGRIELDTGSALRRRLAQCRRGLHNLREAASRTSLPLSSTSTPPGVECGDHIGGPVRLHQRRPPTFRARSPTTSSRPIRVTGTTSSARPAS